MGDEVSAERHLVRALELYVMTDERQGQGEILSVLGRISSARGSPPEALDYALRAVRMLESVRVSQTEVSDRLGIYRQSRDVYLLALQLAATVENGPAALEVIEAARADALASVLRRGQLAVGGEVGALLEKIRLLEAALAEHDDFASDGRAVVPVATRAASRRARTEELDTCYAELAGLTSAAFAAAWAPALVSSDPGVVRQGLPAGAHALVYEVDERDAEHPVLYVVWLAPEGEPVVERTVLEGPAAGLIARYARRDRAVAAEADPLPYALTAQVLLPSGLRELLARQAAAFEAGESVEPIELVVVPAAGLWALPWAALEVDGRRLIELASVSLAPSLGVQAALTDRSIPDPKKEALVCFGVGADLEAGRALEREALQTLFPGAEASPGEFTDRLRAATYAHVVVSAVHGAPPETATVGLDHAVDLGGGVALRAGDLLEATLAGTLTLGACWIASAITGPGEEPLSLPAVALCMGARAVCGGILALPDAATGELLVDYYSRLANAEAPHRALRAAQLDYLAEHPDAAPAEWAGLVVTGHAAGAGGASSA